ncbi:MAG: site-2 protease family protein [Pseudomonadota bacterium]
MRKNKYLIHILLFFVTLFTTLLSGTYLSGYDPFQNPMFILRGIPFSFTLMFILFAHELGHYYFARKWQVNVTLPYFIPGIVLPAPYISIGTFGAFIMMKSRIKTRNALFDIGASGPIISFLFSLIAFIIGLMYSRILPYPPAEHGMFLGESILLKCIFYILYGVDSDRVTIMLHPMALAAWFGFLVTMLNLIPIGQLDGGHILYSIFGKAHKNASRILIFAMLILGYFTWPGWAFWGFLLIVMGSKHPPVEYENIPLSKQRKIISIFLIIILILIIIPEPFIFN